ncbi:MAG: four helix bundle protein [Candidatus Omnitrophica bacterium]|nr:four helix bundle protein [Candidatus Omnitrophota bacterium]
MTYKRFEDLPVWKAGIQLAERVFALVEDRSFNHKGDLRNQLQRAATSVSNNVAEGFERGTTQELLTFLYIARGSAGEVRSMLHLLDRMPYFQHLKSEISNLRSLGESISRQLRAWADSLQNSDIKGQRHLTQAVRNQHEQKARATAFLAQLERIRAGDQHALEELRARDEDAAERA